MKKRLLPLFACVFSVSLSAAVPTPESYFGHPIGADRTVLDWEKVVGYFNLLARSSDRIRVEELGKTAEGRPFIAATIAEPRNPAVAVPLSADPAPACRSPAHPSRGGRTPFRPGQNRRFINLFHSRH